MRGKCPIGKLIGQHQGQPPSWWHQQEEREAPPCGGVPEQAGGGERQLGRKRVGGQQEQCSRETLHIPMVTGVAWPGSPGKIPVGIRARVVTLTA